MRILVIRLSALGDIVMASGLIPALRSRWPGATIAWLAEPAGANLLEANPGIDAVIYSPRGEWRALAREQRYLALTRAGIAFARSLYQRRFDLVLDAQGLLKSGVAAWLTGAPRRVGLGSREGSARLMTEVVTPPRDEVQIASEYRLLAEHLGIDTSQFAMRLPVTAQDKETAGEVLHRHGVTGRYAVLCPFTTRPQKHWFDARWRQLAAALTAQYGLVSVILGGPDDHSHAEALATEPAAAAINLAGTLTLRQCVAVIRRAEGLVGVDTALTHMGTAEGVPTVALFGSTRPYLETDSPLTRVLYEPLWCSPCRRHPICNGVHSCMRLHRVEGVLSELAALLARRP